MEFSLKDVQLYPDSLKGVFGSISFDGAVIPPGLGQDILFMVLVIFFIFYSIISGVLFYHWRTYGMKNKLISSAQLLFLFVSCALFWAALLLVIQ